MPHIGWNDAVSVRDHPVLGASGSATCFYYVHSYHVVPESPVDVLMRCDYGQPFAAAIGRGRIVGVQFHPEKSHAAGLEVLKRFVEVPGAQATADSVPVPAERAHRA